ncbi:Hypothetical_protein [Hexamita inflata]|uniref:Hypothetical_protein n=1 Tax=Hexamita inflata TaxID=28002 RepID=A0AA86UW81_9EUKA|nr:Hypothetical protein HINF_LOCUS12189 [Hexamita inflata]CAI9970419.1 Hypothetical protein HINF_LOCUS58064 [Hexamita inflata]
MKPDVSNKAPNKNPKQYKKFQTQRERKMERMHVPLSEQLKGKERKINTLLRNEPNFLEKVLRQVENEQKQNTRTSNYNSFKNKTQELPEVPEKPKLKTRAEREEEKQQKLKQKEEKIANKKNAQKKKCARNAKGQPVQSKLVGFFLQKLQNEVQKK